MASIAPDADVMEKLQQEFTRWMKAVVICVLVHGDATWMAIVAATIASGLMKPSLASALLQDGFRSPAAEQPGT